MPKLRLPTTEVRVDAFGFDLDGVMRDTGILAYENCCKAIAELGGTPPGFADFVESWRGSLVEYYRECGVTRPDAEIRRLNDRYLPSHDTVEPFAGVAATLEHLESVGMKMFALSGHATNKVQGWCLQHGLHVRFAHIAGDGREKVSQLRALCLQLSVDPAVACYVGDWAQDMRAAKGVGMIPLGISRGHPTHAVLMRAGATHVIDHLSELSALVR